MGVRVCMPRGGGFGISFGDAVLTRSPSHLQIRLEFVSESTCRSMGHPGRRMDTTHLVVHWWCTGGLLDSKPLRKDKGHVS